MVHIMQVIMLVSLTHSFGSHSIVFPEFDVWP